MIMAATYTAHGIPSICNTNLNLLSYQLGTSDDAFGLYVDLWYKITIQNITFTCNLDKITVQLPRMHCKSEAYQNDAKILDYFLQIKMSKNTLKNRARTAKIGEYRAYTELYKPYIFYREICSSFSTQCQ